MNWTAVWDTATGALISVGTVVANPLPAGMSTTALGSSPPVGNWSATTHTFDGVAPKSVLSLHDFVNRFTQSEREAIWTMEHSGTATQQTKLGAFRDYLVQCGYADLADAYIQSSVQLMETVGLIAAGRAAQILA